MQRTVNVIDIGSKKISAMVGGKGINGSFNIKVFLKEKYDGFASGEFFSLQSLKMALSELINKIEVTTKKPFTQCFVGIPAEFCVVKTAISTLTFDKQKNITEKIVNELCDVALSGIKNIDDLMLINRAPIAFTTGSGKRTTNTKGLKAQSITAELCFVFVKKSFGEELLAMLREIGIISCDFVCSALAEILFLLSDEKRKNECVLIDVGYISTFVTLAKGEGLCEMFAFSLGGGHISGDLSECLKIKYNDAESLKQKIILSVDKNDKDIYNIDSGARTFPVMAKVAHEICEARIEDIASHINYAINSFKSEFPKTKEVYLTGGGICSIKGGKDFLSKSLGRAVEIAKSPALMLREPCNSSVLSVLNFALLISDIERRRK